jgi:hypothetical protein
LQCKGCARNIPIIFFAKRISLQILNYHIIIIILKSISLNVQDGKIKISNADISIYFSSNKAKKYDCKINSRTRFIIINISGEKQPFSVVKNEQEKMVNFFGKTKKLYYFTVDLKLPILAKK